MDLELLDGGLLGDTHLVCQSNASGHLQITSAQVDWAEFALHSFEAEFGSAGPSQVWVSCANQNCGCGGTHAAWATRTLAHPSLVPHRDRWYADRFSGFKRCPPDVRVTNRSLLLWYLGNGSLERSGRHAPNSRSVVIAAQNFTKDEIDFILRPKLAALGLPFERHVAANGRWRLYLPAHARRRFFDVVGWKSPIRCYDYKFQVPDYVRDLTLKEAADILEVGWKWARDAVARWRVPIVRSGNGRQVLLSEPAVDQLRALRDMFWTKRRRGRRLPRHPSLPTPSPTYSRSVRPLSSTLARVLGAFDGRPDAGWEWPE